MAPSIRQRIARVIAMLGDDEPGPSDPSTALTIPRRSASLRSVTTTEAFSLSMVYRAVQILTTSVKQLSLDNYRDSKEIRKPLWMRTPSTGVSLSSFLEQTVVSLACAGNAYWHIVRTALGAVESIRVLNPLGAVIQTNSSGEITGYSFPGEGDFKPEQIKQLRLLRIPGTAYGLGPIQAAQVELRGALDLRDYSSNWFEESGVPTGVLTSDQAITKEVAEEAKGRWNETQGARKGVAVLGNNLSYAAIYMSPADAQFLESRQFDVTQIARLFGVPSSLMLATVEGATDTYQNVSQDWLGFVRFSLMAYLIEIEDALTELLPNPQEAKFNVEALLRSDTTTRYAAHKTALDAGFMTVNEVRAIENLTPFEDETYNAPTPARTPTKEPVNA